MTHTGLFDLPAKQGLDRSLGQAARDVERYFANPADGPDALQDALAGLHRTCGELRGLSLDGAAVFCGEIEKLLQEIAAGALQPSSACGDILRRSLFSLTHYLDALAGGASNAALRLFPLYQELQHARGTEMAFEEDLFYPDLRVELPQSVLVRPQAPDPQARIKQARGKYQTALLKWLRHDRPAEALQSMRGAVQAVMECVPQDRQRAFWWAASALLDCLIYRGLPPEQRPGKLLGRIDMQMKFLVDGQLADTHGILHELLYLIACSQPVSGTVAAVKQVYALESYLPQADALPASKTDPLLESMRAQLEVTKEGWEQCARGGSATPELAGQLARLSFLADKLDRNTLQHLCHQIQNIAAQANSAEQIRHIAQDMAMALLLLGSGIAHYRHLDDGFQEQARILSQRLQAAMAGTAQDKNKLSGLIALYCKMEERSVTATLAGEIQANLQHVEQGLNAFFADMGKSQALTAPCAPLGTTKPEPVPRLGQMGGLLHQAQGGLYILSLDRPGQLLGNLQQTVKYYADGGRPTSGEMHTVVATLGALQEYIQNLAHEQQPDTAQLDVALQDMQALQPPPVAQLPDTQTPDAAATAVTHAPGEGDELLEVFLEEAQEVLEGMRAHLETIQLQPASREPLATIRRGFHTLKGSGRMVGLADLAEVAWAVERAMNKWLQGNKPATPGLLKFIADAKTAFQGWVDSLHAQGSAKVETEEWVASAQRIESDLDATPVAQPAEPAPTAASPPVSAAAPAEPPAIVAETEPPPVVIGAVTLSSNLFGIATEEAAQHVAALLRHLAGLRAGGQPSIAYDFVRAAHTLAGVNRTMGFVRIAELAHALEQWLEARIGQPLAPDDTQLALLERVIAALDGMGLTVRQRREPQAQPELIAQLQADRLVQPAPAPEIAAAEIPIAEIPTPQAPTKIAQLARPAVEKRMAQDDMDEQLLPIFLEEVDELYPQVGNGMRAWREQPDDKLLGRSLQRSLHTLKGSARMAGAMRMGELTHLMEERVVQAMSQAQYDATFWDELENYFDRIGGALEQLRSMPAAGRAEADGVTALRDAAPRTRPEHGIGAERAALAAMLRVRSDTVDRLVNEAGEISVTRSRIEAELRAFRSGLLELTDSVSHLRKQLREIGIQAESRMQARVSLVRDAAEKFDPLEFDRFTRFQELTRFMNESVHDVQTVQQTLLKNLDEMAAALSAQTYLNRELQQNLMAIRMVPFSSIGERLYRVVRQTGKELNKKANLELHGTEVELDRSVLEKMTAPLEHLLRNAIAHGLEDTQQRERAGKSPIGDIRLSLRQENNEVMFEFSDDGAGLDFARLRRKAADMGLLQEGGETSDEQIIQLIFTPGLTTATEVTEVSGRGVGMDVVRSEIAALGGRIEVFSEHGNGVRFLIHLPLTLAATHVLMVHAGQAVYAIPSTMVEQVQQIKPAALEEIYQRGQVEWQGKLYPLHYLPRLLGNEEGAPESRSYNRILLLRSGEQRLAVHVDELVGKQEVVVKNIGPQLARLPGIAGATVLGNGSVVLILNPMQLAQRALGAPKAIRAAAVEPVSAAPLVMVVDDSLTVRKITSRLLVRAGYQVATAKDGVDALEQLGGIAPAVMLLDIEMPRMDGFELTQRLRRDPKTRNLPIIIITSRTAEKHRNYAQELGVNAYLGKPYQEKELLQHIAAIVTAHHVSSQTKS